ncbi:hypothetical protein [Candidatus Enterococcus leclercqii]|uniref:hypothetical protein n=1 Tax=Candidatus Enterococcus leclercqii TaxID=1857218 RepID=UPI00137B1ABE|nr:hypothetical protein [Enterococcus sp. CU9D]KAF1294192.1 hypothetical protein BAU14_07325 [Enterococcus sp. CU9D]
MVKFEDQPKRGYSGIRTLETIASVFEDIQASSDLRQGEKNLRYLQLMNELGEDHGAMILNPTEADLKLPEVVLYRKVSQARVF